MNDVTQFFLTLWWAQCFSKMRSNKKRRKPEAEIRRMKRMTVEYTLNFDLDKDNDIIDFLVWTFMPDAYVISLMDHDCSDSESRDSIQFYSKYRMHSRSKDDVQTLNLKVNRDLYPAVVTRLSGMDEVQRYDYISRLIREDNKYQRETGIIDISIELRLYKDEFFERMRKE